MHYLLFLSSSEIFNKYVFVPVVELIILKCLEKLKVVVILDIYKYSGSLYNEFFMNPLSVP